MSEAIKWLTGRRDSMKRSAASAEREIGELSEQIEAQRQHIAVCTTSIVELDDAIARLGGTGG